MLLLLWIFFQVPLSHAESRPATPDPEKMLLLMLQPPLLFEQKARRKERKRKERKRRSTDEGRVHAIDVNR